MARCVSGTLTPDTVDTVALNNRGREFNIVNRSQTGTIWVRIDGLDPTVAGDDCYPVLGVRTFVGRFQVTTVKLISSDGLDYTVESEPW